MPTTNKPRQIITDKLVVEQTGQLIEHWFLLFDERGCKKLTHAEIFAMSAEIPALNIMNEWNRNLLTTSYEWSRGLKERGEKKNGFEISVSKVIGAELSDVYKKWFDPRLRNLWLTESIDITTARENKSLRVSWMNEGSRLSVDFYEKTKGKTQVVVQHLKLPSANAANQMKLFWQAKLGQLTQLVEKVNR